MSNVQNERIREISLAIYTKIADPNDKNIENHVKLYNEILEEVKNHRPNGPREPLGIY